MGVPYLFLAGIVICFFLMIGGWVFDRMEQAKAERLALADDIPAGGDTSDAAAAMMPTDESSAGEPSDEAPDDKKAGEDAPEDEGDDAIAEKAAD